MKFLLDTNVLSELARISPDPGVVERFRRHGPECAISVLTWHELTFGWVRLPPSRKRLALGTFIDTVAARAPVLPYDARAARWHALERAQLAAKGRLVPFVAGQIVATAVVNELTLVTRNARDFVAFRGLTAESWHSR